MNKLNYKSAFFILFACTACIDNHELSTEKKLIGNAPFIWTPLKANSMRINRELSSIRWKGTKMLRTAGHEGVVDIREGFLLFKNDSLVGGKVIAEMSTVRIINKSDQKESNMLNLSKYLRKRAVASEKYPIASFEITQVNYLGGDSLRIRGNMNIRDVVKDISFPAVIKRSGINQEFYAELSLDRFEWNIGVDGNLLEVNLVDKEFKLMINLLVKED